MEKVMKCWSWCFKAKQKKKKFVTIFVHWGNKQVSKIPQFIFRGGGGGFAALNPPSRALPWHPTWVCVAPGPQPFRLSTPQALFPIPVPEVDLFIIV